MFKFKVGKFSITEKWETPIYQKFLNWYNEWVTQTPLVDYDIHLVGGFAEKLINPLHETQDVDIILTGDISDYKILKDGLNTAMELGFKHKLFIDISWVNTNVWNQHIAIRRGVVVNPNQDFSRIRTFYKFEKFENGKTSKVDFSNSFTITKLINGLYQLDGYDSTTTDKVVKRVEGDIYKGIYMELNNVVR